MEKCKNKNKKKSSHKKVSNSQESCDLKASVVLVSGFEELLPQESEHTTQESELAISNIKSEINACKHSDQPLTDTLASLALHQNKSHPSEDDKIINYEPGNSDSDEIPINSNFPIESDFNKTTKLSTCSLKCSSKEMSLITEGLVLETKDECSIVCEASISSAPPEEQSDGCNKQEINEEITIKVLENQYENKLAKAALACFQECYHYPNEIKGTFFFKLVKKFLKSKYEYAKASEEFADSLQTSNSIKDSVWTQRKHTCHCDGECSDGKVIRKIHDYYTAKFNQSMAQKLKKQLKNGEEILFDSILLHKTDCLVLELEIEGVITQVIYDYLSGASKAKLMLKEIVSVLFYFSSNPFIQEWNCQKKIHHWLELTVGFYLRSATFEDEIFILFNLLHYPIESSVSCANFLQCSTVNGSLSLDKCYILMSIILNPSQWVRKDFLCEYTKYNEDWVVLDSDGEEKEEIGGIYRKESDVLGLLSQIPLGKVIELMLNMETWCSQTDNINSDCYEKMLKQLSFATSFISLLQTSIQLHNETNFKHLIRRLLRLIQHVVHYMTDHWECHNLKMLPLQRHKIQIAYDKFILYCCWIMYSCPQKLCLQYLGELPFHLVSEKMLECLWYHFHLNFQNIRLEDVENSWHKYNWLKEWKEQFIEINEFLKSMDESTLLLLIMTFVNMVLCSDNINYEFITAVSEDIFEIGFLNVDTREKCSKTCKDSLSSLCLKHPWLISNLLKQIQVEVLKLGKMSFYLCSELPWELWTPSSEVLDILENWVINYEATSIENQLGCYILNSLNFHGSIGAEMQLPIEIQRTIAMFVCKAYMKHVYSCSPSLSDSIKQAASYYNRPYVSNVSFEEWCWSIISKMCLHVMTCSSSVLEKYKENNISKFLNSVPQYSASSLLKQGVKEKIPFICYISLLMTDIGHIIPLICQEGLHCLTCLLKSGYKIATIEVLGALIPLFYNSPEDLHLFNTIVEETVNDDNKSYLIMAKSLLIGEANCTIRNFFICMMIHQVKKFTYLNAAITSEPVLTWLNLFTSIKNWNANVKLLEVLDILLEFAFIHFTIWNDVIQRLHNVLMNEEYKEESKGQFSSVMQWFGGSLSSLPSFLSKSRGILFPYYVYASLEVSTKLENLTKVWSSLLSHISEHPNQSVESSLKKACQDCYLQPMSVGSLCIYKWADKLLELKIHHPLIFPFCQQFFMRYLYRAPLQSKENSYASKFMEGHYFKLMKQIKKKLQEILDYYHALAKESGNSCTQKICELKASMCETFLLWLEEPQLHDPTLYLEALPKEYDSTKLKAIFSNSEELWWDYVDTKAIQLELDEFDKLWALNRGLNNKRELCPQQINYKKIPPHERVQKRINSYDLPKPPPNVSLVDSHNVPVKTEDLEDPATLMLLLRCSIDNLVNISHKYSLDRAEWNASDASYVELLYQLYQDFPVDMLYYVACSGDRYNTSNCSGPCPIPLQFTESRLNENIKYKLEQNRLYLSGITAETLCPSLPVLKNILILDYSRKALIQFYLSTHKLCYKLSGISLFYNMAEVLNEEMLNFAFGRKFLLTNIDKLGEVFLNCPQDQFVLLQFILGHSSIVQILGQHFYPNEADGKLFVQMYTYLSEAAAISDLHFVLLSKFDMKKWLTSKTPIYSDRLDILNVIGKAFVKFGVDPKTNVGQCLGLYRNHFRCLLLHEFPRHLKDGLLMLLRYTESHSIDPTIWYDILDCLLPGSEQSESSHDTDYFTYISKLDYAVPINQLEEILRHLGQFFLEERMSFGLHGVYPKYADYVLPISKLICSLYHLWLVLIIKVKGDGSLVLDVLHISWSQLCALLSPWILPINIIESNLASQCSDWLKELNKDRHSLTPFTNEFQEQAAIMWNTFITCATTLQNIDMGHKSNVLSLVLHYYIMNFASPSVKENVLLLCHEALSKLQWRGFFPSLDDMEYFSRVLERYLPLSHTFIGKIFVQIDWTKIILQFHEIESLEKMYHYYLNSLVKLAHEPEVKQDKRYEILLAESTCMNWNNIDNISYHKIMDWFVISCDCKAVVLSQSESISVHVLRLLQVVGGWNYSSDSCVSKSIIYVKSYLRIIISCASKYKNLLNKSPDSFSSLFSKFLSELTTLNGRASVNQELLPLVLNEVMAFLNNCSPPLQQIVTDELALWISSLDKFQVLECTKCCALVLDDEKHCFLMECCINNFIENVIQSSLTSNKWKEIMPFVDLNKRASENLISFCLDKGHFCYLHLIVLSFDNEAALSVVNGSLSKFKPETVDVKWENKFLPWMKKCAEVILHEVNEGSNVSGAMTILNSLLTKLTVLSENHSNIGLLSVIGFGKKSNLSLRFRLFCRCISVYLYKKACCVLGDQDSGHESLRLAFDKHRDIPDNLNSLKSQRQYRPYIGVISHTLVSSNTQEHFDLIFQFLVSSLFLENKIDES